LKKIFCLPLGRLVPVTIFSAALLFNCSTLPPVQAVKDMKSFAGKWHGRIWNQTLGWDSSFSLTVEEDGYFFMSLPSFDNPGLISIIGKWGLKDDGRIWFKSEVFWMNGTGILHEGGRNRYVIFTGDDEKTRWWVESSSWEGKSPASK